MKRALLSVSDKNGIVELAQALVSKGYEIVSTGGTAKLLREEHISVTDVAEITHFPEALGGRVKTLHPVIHAGILARRDVAEDMDFLEDEEIVPIDLVAINLYPFKEVIMKPDTDLALAIENIDIGGPTLLRAAAKNAQSVTVLCDPEDYKLFLETEENQLANLRRRLQAKAFRHTAYYDSLVSNYLTDHFIAEEYQRCNGDAELETEYQEHITDAKSQLVMAFDQVQTLRYGENPHQAATYYQNSLPLSGSLPMAKQLQGKELSYNNIQDANAALEIIKEFEMPTVVAVKHANPCGVGSAETLEEAWHLAYEADPVSIFGGIVAVNREVSLEIAQELAKIFLEIVICPSLDEKAEELLKKRKSLRVLILPNISEKPDPSATMAKTVYGGLLVQEMDRGVITEDDIRVVTQKGIDEDDFQKIQFAMKVVKHVKSNAICLTQGFQTVGIGPGQTNRITAVEIATRMAGAQARGSIMASDAFFPFDDCVRAAAEAGVRLIVQPGGSIRDEDSIRACDELGIAMVFTGKRHFRH